MPLAQHALSEREIETTPTSKIEIIPQPNFLVLHEGFFYLDLYTVVVGTGRAEYTAHFISDVLSRSTGYPVSVSSSKDIRGPYIELRLDTDCGSLGPEGYRLRITPHKVEILAEEPAGLFYGCQTLLQLLPDAIYSNTPVLGRVWSIPCVEIEDSPRFDWRGAMLDLSRHFMPVEFLRKFIDLLAMHKLNVLHLHLNDDQGWRLEIKKYPKLTSVGAFRPETLVGRALQDPADKDYDPNRQPFDGIPHSGYYTQNQMRDLVKYAASRHVRIVPEIEMPGHAQAAVAAYPELGCTDIAPEVSRAWGIHPTLFNAEDSTIAFLQHVLTEVMEIFPSIDIHVGGDEAVKTQWKESPACQRRIKELGLKDESELQSWFIRQMDEFLSSHGRCLVGWDEILEGGLAPNATVMSWRGEAGGLAAAAIGHDVIMSDHEHTYLDYYQTLDRSNEPQAFPNTLTLSKVYGHDPVPVALPAEYAHHVLGAQGQLWTEYMPTPAQVEYQAFPRLCALAEVTWTEYANKDFNNFMARLAEHVKRLDVLDVNYRPIERGEGEGNA